MEGNNYFITIFSYFFPFTGALQQEKLLIITSLFSIHFLSSFKVDYKEIINAWTRKLLHLKVQKRDETRKRTRKYILFSYSWTNFCSQKTIKFQFYFNAKIAAKKASGIAKVLQNNWNNNELVKALEMKARRTKQIKTISIAVNYYYCFFITRRFIINEIIIAMNDSTRQRD